MDESKKIASQKPVEAPKASYHILPELPRHFSAISAQNSGKPHDEEAHQRMVHELKSKGYHPVDTQGHYGVPEKSVMIEHQGSPVDHKTIEAIAFNGHGQESVVHSSKGHDGERHNRMVYADASKPAEHGTGVEWGHHLGDYYSELPSGHRFQLKIGNHVEKSDHHKKPHYYGKLEGVHVFHGTHDYHKNLVGQHLDSPTEEQLKSALSEAKGKGGVVVIHGAPPDSLRSRIHSKLGPVLPGAVKKSSVGSALRDLKERIDSDISDDNIEKRFTDFEESFQKSFGVFPEEYNELVPGKELSANGERQCPECGSPSIFCDCYKGLPLPEIHFDSNSKKLSVFFKSDWDVDARTAFLEDIKRRAISLVLAKAEKQ